MLALPKQKRLVVGWLNLAFAAREPVNAHEYSLRHHAALGRVAESNNGPVSEKHGKGRAFVVTGNS